MHDKLAGLALQCRWLWLQKTDEDRAWAELPLHTEPEVQAFFQASILVIVGDGERTKFWTDNWLDGRSIASWAPTLTAAVSRRVQKTATVAHALHDDRWTRDITGDLSEAAVTEYLRLWNRLQDVHLAEGVQDQFVWRWTSSGQYTAKSAYKMMLQGTHRFEGAKLIWKTWAPLKVKLFLWLAFRRRHWTADRRQRHGLETHANCVLCDQEPESSDHLFIDCSFTKQVWWPILQRLGASQLPRGGCSLPHWWARLKDPLPVSKRKGFDSLFALTTWQIWKERNARVFRGDSSDPHALLVKIRHEAHLWILAGAKELGCLCCE